MTIVLADTDVRFRENLKRRLEKITGLHVVGESSGALETTAMILNRKPDIAILNTSLQDGRGIDVLRQIKRLMIPPTIIIVTDNPSHDDQADCSLAGANFFLEKATEGHKIIQTLHLLCVPPTRTEALGLPIPMLAD
ncbi:MAG: response regulator [Nitrospiraceae bacterium]